MLSFGRSKAPSVSGKPANAVRSFRYSVFLAISLMVLESSQDIICMRFKVDVTRAMNIPTLTAPLFKGNRRTQMMSRERITVIRLELFIRIKYFRVTLVLIFRAASYFSCHRRFTSFV